MQYQPDPALEWAPRVIFRAEVGSTAHGTGLDGHEDHDEIGIMLLPWEQAIGVPLPPDNRETIVYRPGRGVGERSQAGDYDLEVHSARKFARLAAQGNPSILVAMFGPTRFTTALGDHLLGIREAFWHQGARFRFLGYMEAQRQRLDGSRGGRHTNRPELVEVHRFDTKHAMHALRLGFQGIEYMTTGAISAPMRPDQRRLLQEVRAGAIRLDAVLDLATSLEYELRSASTDAPPEPRWATINEWLLACFDESRRIGGDR